MTNVHTEQYRGLDIHVATFVVTEPGHEVKYSIEIWVHIFLQNEVIIPKYFAGVYKDKNKGITSSVNDVKKIIDKYGDNLNSLLNELGRKGKENCIAPFKD